MANFQNLLDEAISATSPVAQIPTLSAEKKDAVSLAAAQKQAALLQPQDYYNIAAGMGNQAGAGSMSPVETDLRTLTPFQLTQKYGAEQANQMMTLLGNAQAQFATDKSRARDNGSFLYDSATGVGTGFAGGIADIASFGVGLVNDELGAAMAKQTQEYRDAVSNSQSAALNSARKAMQAELGLKIRDNEAQFQADVAAGNSETGAGLERFFADLGDALVTGASDPTTLAQGTAEGLGSLLVAGPVAKGVKAGALALTERGTGAAAGVVTAGGARVNAAIDAAALPVAIGTMEAGGTYSQTANAVLNTPTEELMKTSPDFRAKVEEYKQAGLSDAEAQMKAKYQLAGETGTEAAAIQAPAAMAAGLLTKYAEAPFKAHSAASAASNIALKEPLEEAIQGTTGTIAQNIAMKDKVDSNQSLVEGAGEQAALGALYGAGAAGATQGPGLAYQGAKKTMQGVFGAAGKAKDALFNAAENRIAENEKASKVAPEKLNEVATSSVATSEADLQTLQDTVSTVQGTPEEKAAAFQYVSSLVQSTKITPEEVAAAPENLKSVYEGSSNSVELAIKLADMVNKAASFEDQVAFGEHLLQVIKKISSLQQADPTVLSNLDAKDPAKAILDRYNFLSANIKSSPMIQGALELALLKLEMESQQAVELTQETISTPEGQAQVNRSVLLAENAPEKVNPEKVRQILEHNDNGDITLTPSQKAALQIALNVVNAHREVQTQNQENGLRAQDVVSGQIISDKGDPAAKLTKRSATSFARDVVSSMLAGNKDLAKAYLNEFGLFVQHMQNKVGALNTSYTNGGGKVKYQSLTASRTWRESATGLDVAIQNRGSVKFARSVAVEAQALAAIYNQVVKAFPELGVAEIQATPLHAELNKENPGKASKPAVATPTVDQPTTPRVSGPDQFAQEDEAARLRSLQKKHGLTEEQITGLASEQKAGIDQTTGWVHAQGNGLKERSIGAAMESRTKDDLVSTFLSIDLANLGGINDFFNNVQKDANDAYRAIADIMREELTKVGGDHIFLRTGGDELAVVIYGAQPKEVEAAMAIARQRVKALAVEKGFDKIKHKKEGLENFGVDIYSGAVEIDPYISIDENAKQADRGLDLQKLAFKEEFKNVQRSTTEEVGTGTSEGQAQGVEASPAPTTTASTTDQQGKPQEQQVATNEAVTPAPVVVEQQPAPVQKPEPVVAAPAPVPAPESVVEAQPAPVEPVAPARPKTLAERFPKLVLGVKNKFLESFVQPKTPRTRLPTENPSKFVSDALVSNATLQTLLGETKVGHVLNNAISSIYQRYLRIDPQMETLGKKEKLSPTEVPRVQNVGGIMFAMRQNLQEFLTTKNRGNLLTNGELINKWVNGKAINIVNNIDGKFDYDQELLEKAALAGIQWFLNAANSETEVHDDDLESMTGLDPMVLSAETRTRLSQGFSLEQVKFGIAKKIQQYWDVQKKIDPENDRAYYDGISEAVAGEVMRALSDLGMMKIDPVELGIQDGLTTPKTIDRFTFQKVGKALHAYPTAIDDVVMIEREDQHYLAGVRPPVSKTQMNNPEVENTPDQLAAIEARQDNAFFVHTPMLNLLASAGLEGVITLFGEGNPEGKIWNKSHLKSIEGSNRTWANALEALLNKAAEIQNTAQAYGFKPEEVQVRYQYNVSKTGRYHMLGRYNPQANKLMRSAVATTWSTLDLTNEADKNAFYLAMAQALDIKIHKMSMEDAVAKVKELLSNTEEGKPSLRPLVQVLRGWMAQNNIEGFPGENPGPFPVNEVKAIFDAAGVPLTPAALNAMVEYTRFLGSKGSTAFRTPLSLEADGITNGPINAMMMLSIGKVTKDFIENVRRGGIAFGSSARSFASLLAGQEDKKDLYEKGTENTYNALSNTMSALSDNPAVYAQGVHVLNLLDLTLKDVSIEDGELKVDSLKRGVIKNPLTITIYGSSASGISGKILDMALEKIYENMSYAAQRMAVDKTLTPAQAFFYGDANAEAKFEKLWDAIDNLTRYKVVTRYIDGERTYGLEPLPGSQDMVSDFQKFEFSKEAYEAMRQNTLQVFVNPMVTAINETVGRGLTSSTEQIKNATQLQSAFYEHMFNRAMEEHLKARKGNAEFKGGDFLTDAEVREIMDSLKDVAPFMKTGLQNYLLTKSRRFQSDTWAFSRALNDQFNTSPNMYLPANVGVGGIPAVTLGFGDAFMMQVLALDPSVKNTLDVFDGLEMPLDKIAEYSRKANQAVFEAYKANPLAEVKKMYDTFFNGLGKEAIRDIIEAENTRVLAVLNGKGKEKSLEKISPLLHTLVRTFRDETEVRELDSLYKKNQDGVWENTTHYGYTTSAGSYSFSEEVVASLEKVQTNLEWAARSVAARHQAYQEIGLSIDNMAGGGVGFSNLPEGVAAPSDVEVMNQLNARIEQLMAESKPEAAPVAEQQEPTPEVVPKAVKTGGQEMPNGARAYSVDDLRALAKTLEMNPAQKTIFDQIIRALEEKPDLRVVVGTAEQVAQESGVTETSNGFYDADSNVMYMVNPSAEVFVHELVHASTYQTVVGVLNGSIKDETIIGSVNKIIGMMQAVLRVDPKQVAAMGPAFEKAYNNMRRAVEKQRDRKNEAGVINEFMAWSLTNAALAEKLATSKLPMVLRLAIETMKAIKQLVWGKKTAPKFEQDNFLSNLQFHTSVLVRSQPKLAGLIANGILQHSTEPDSRLVALRQSLAKRIGVPMDILVTNGVVSVNDPTPLQFGIEFTQRVSSTFPMSSEEKSTFAMLSAVLATEMGLDSNFLVRAQELYSHVVKNLTVEHFMPENSVNPDRDRYYAEQKFDLIVGKEGRAVDKHGRTTMLSSFIGLATVNEEFRKILSDLDLPKTMKNEASTFDAKVENLGYKATDALSKRLVGEKMADNVLQAVDGLNNHLVALTLREKTFGEVFLGKVGGVVDSVNEYIVDKVSTLANKGWEFSQRTKDDPSRVKSFLGNVAGNLSALGSEEIATAAGEGYLALAGQTNMPKALHDLTKDLIGRVGSNANVYDMIKRVRSTVQQIRQQFRENVPHIIAQKFTKHLLDEEWATMFRTMAKTDLALLLSKFSPTDVVNLFKNPSEVENQIANLEESLMASLDNWDLYQSKMKQLANYMNTGIAGNYLLRNAHAISRLPGTSKPKSWKAPSDATVEQMDMLVTLYALQGLNQADLDSMADLAETEQAGLEFVLNYLQGQRNTEQAKVNDSLIAKLNSTKGYIPSTPENGLSLVVAPSGDRTKMNLQGYEEIETYTGSRLEKRSLQSYYFAPMSLKAGVSQGIMQNIKHTSGGVDENFGYSTEPNGGRITDPTEVERIAKSMNRDTATVEHLVPVFDDAGKIIAFERSLDPKIQAMLKQSQHLGKMLGVWRGRQIEEKLSYQFNRELVDKLHSMWEADKISPANKDNYVDLFTTKDPVYEDMVDLFSAHTLELIRNRFGADGGFPVRKDMIDDVIGFRNASIGGIFNGNTRFSPKTQEVVKNVFIATFGVKASQKLLKGEQFVQGVMADARTLIVVKSMVIPAFNFISNMYQLISRGVPVTAIGRGVPEKLSEINHYAKNRIRQIEIEAELRAVGSDAKQERRLRAEIRSLQDSNRRMSIWPLIEAGEFSSVADVGMTASDLELTSGQFFNWFEKKINDLPPGLQTAARYGYVSRDTALFQGLQKSVQYGDFIAKAVLFDDLTKRKGLTKEQALARITEEFVNYDRLPGRTRGYLENMGLLWFYNYKIRISKVALSTIRNNPLHALLALAAPAPNGAGLPITDNVFSVGLDGDLDYSMGPGMGVHAMTLNPWWNLTH